jgi:Glycine zipper
MRIKALLVLSVFAVTALPAIMPAAAQNYPLRSCSEAKRDNQVGGAILGGLIGGVLGSNVAASGHRGDGTAVGAVLGGLVGQGIGKDTTHCSQPPRTVSGYGYAPGSTYNPNPAYGGSRYNDYGYNPAPAGVYPYDPGDSSYRSGDYGYDRGYRGDNVPHGGYRPDLYPSDRPSYNQGEDYAGSDCSEATQITRLPDGSEVHRPIEVCRDAYYGDWQIKD